MCVEAQEALIPLYKTKQNNSDKINGSFLDNRTS
jgi:hypothetical protein